jgi:NAD(P)-dependent dehydrogenase (short-subunit alcohol dehydrogenase family)
MSRQERAIVSASPPNAPLAGKKALVLGAGTPAGALAARALAEAGADVAVASTSLDGDEVMAVRRVRRAVAGAGRRTAEYSFDLTLPTNVKVSTRQVAKEMGGLHLLVNASDLYLRRGTAETSDADWARVLNLNLNGVFYTIRTGLHEMGAAGGRIIVFTSVLGARGDYASVAYAAARHGVAGLIHAVALEQAANDFGISGVALDFAPAIVSAQSLSYGDSLTEPRLARLGRLVVELSGPLGRQRSGEIVELA